MASVNQVEGDVEEWEHVSEGKPCRVDSDSPN